MLQDFKDLHCSNIEINLEIYCISLALVRFFQYLHLIVNCNIQVY